MPSRDVAADAAYYTRVLGGELVWAIERFETRVAEVRLTGDGPRLLVAQHLPDEASVLVFRVADIEAAIAELEAGGAEIEGRDEIPYGPIATLRTVGGQRLAIYERTRPERGDSLPGRFDFEPTP
jgi:predicted enzyme related to lactoylglutathione lyase